MLQGIPVSQDNETLVPVCACQSVFTEVLSFLKYDEREEVLAV